MRSHSYLNTAKDILHTYDGQLPLHMYLRDYFKSNKKCGSNDRKQIAQLCFSFFRLGNSFNLLETGDQLLVAVFLCSDKTPLVITELKPEWAPLVAQSLENKLELLHATHEINSIFPFLKALSAQIDQTQFSRSFLVQPSLFLRTRPGKKNHVQQQFDQAGIVYRCLEDDILELSIGTNIEEVIRIDEEAVVQDLNSQQVIKLVAGKFENHQKITIWDCCAGSGGKSILFHDHFPKATLTVSDARESILINLRKRFKRAGIHHHHQFIADISNETWGMAQTFDLVICDAPCSGSGTWSRTPEQMLFFEHKTIEYYAALQKKIVANAGKYLTKNGLFLYITCSVFTKENEEVVDYIKDQLGLQLLQSSYYKGYERKADTLFAALFTA